MSKIYNVTVITDEYEKIEFKVEASFWLDAVSLATQTQIVKDHINYKMLIQCDDLQVSKVECIDGKLFIEE